MTATITPTATPAPQAERAGSTPRLWRTGLVAGVAAATATVAVAATAHGLDVSLQTAPGKAIPVIGFGQLTLFFTAIGVLLARAIGRRARRPRAAFTTTTILLTALSFVPDLVITAGAATKATLVLSHVVAAAIVIPALASRLPERSPRAVGSSAR